VLELELVLVIFESLIVLESTRPFAIGLLEKIKVKEKQKHYFELRRSC